MPDEITTPPPAVGPINVITEPVVTKVRKQNKPVEEENDDTFDPVAIYEKGFQKGLSLAKKEPVSQVPPVIPVSATPPVTVTTAPASGSGKEFDILTYFEKEL